MQSDKMSRENFSTFIESFRGVDSFAMIEIVSRNGSGLGMAPEWVARG
jgi:hypothetical protein